MTASRADLPIGVFDSGLGGLTVVKQLRQRMPEESIVYLGDTARVPYGTRSPATIIRYARGCAHLLMERKVKALVIACNTASAVALDVLRAELDVEVVGVVGPGAAAAVRAAEELGAQGEQAVKIGVLGTAGTIRAGAYPTEVAKVSSRFEVIQRAAPLLVPLVEEGWTEGELPSLAVDRYLAPLLEQGARVVVLGCTHYPLLKSLILARAEKLCSGALRVVDGAEATAQHLEAILVGGALRSRRTAPGSLSLLVSDMPHGFAESASRFLGEPVAIAEQVDVTPA